MEGGNSTQIEHLATSEKHAIIGVIAIIFSFGSLGNLTICFVYKKVVLLPRLSSELIINLAVCDILLCLHTGFMIHGLLTGPKSGPDSLLCNISGYIRFVLTFASFAAVTLIMIKRYCTITRLGKNGLCNYSRILILITWVYHMCLGIAPLMGWSRYTFSYGKLACTCRIKTSASFSIVVSITSMIGPLCVLVFCTTKIFERLKEMRKLSDRGVSYASRLRRRDEFRGNVILFGVIVNYFVCAAPFIIVNLLEAFIDGFTIPLRVDIATSIITQMMPAVNPVLFGFGNEKFRKAFRQIIKRSSNRRVQPAPLKGRDKIKATSMAKADV